MCPRPETIKSRLLATCLVLVLSGSPLAGISLPDDGFSEGWIRAGKTLHFVGNDLYGHINGGAELFHEFGFLELFVQRYVREGKEVDLEVYRMESPEAALGIYLIRCGREKPVKGITARNSGNRYQFTVVKGSFFLQVNSFSGDEEQIPFMVGLVQHTLADVQEEQPVELFEALPKKNLVTGSERIICGPYALQPIFTFGEGNILQLGGEVLSVVGDYADSTGSLHTLIAVRYPEEAAAASALKGLQAGLDPHLVVLDRWERGFTFRDYQGKFGLVEKTANAIELRINLSGKPVRQGLGKSNE